jgi:hypothetical protein
MLGAFSPIVKLGAFSPTVDLGVCPLKEPAAFSRALGYGTAEAEEIEEEFADSTGA